MKATQYITGDGISFVKKQVFPSEKMNRDVSVSIGDEILSDDFLGFGVAITASSCYELNTMEPQARKKLLSGVYGKDGLNFGIGRLTVGSSDYSPELYSYDDVEGDISLEHFSVERDKAYVIPMIKEILKIRPDLYLFASPWSPPAWMKTGGCLCGGYMRNEYIDCYANYIVKYLLEYEKCGIKIRALTPQNEPHTQARRLMPACEWHPDTEAEFIKILKKKLKEADLDVKIWMYDHNFDGAPRVLWMLDNHKQLLENADGAAFHYYCGKIEETDIIREKYPDFPLHFTEGGPRLNDNYATDWCKWSIMMANVLNHGYKSFTGWNLMLDENGDPNVGPHFCGGLITLNSQNGETAFSGQYRAFMHFSHFFSKGTAVLKPIINRNSSGMYSYPKMEAPIEAAALRDPNGTTAVIMINPDKNTKKQVVLNVGGADYYVELLPDTVSSVVISEA